jgi:uroporphyrinogen decarboxylase
VERAVRDGLGTDAAMVRQGGPSPGRWELRLEAAGDDRELTDEFGVRWRQPRGNALYFDMVGHPLAGDIGVVDVERYPWPDPLDPHRFDGMREQAHAIIEDEGRATCVGSISTGLFELGQRMRGFEQFVMDMLDEEASAEALLDKALELKLAYWGRVLETAGDLLDVIVETDDYGTQQSLLLSPSTWRTLIGPRLRVLSDLIHAKGRAKVFLHSCGAIRELIPDLIAAGVDILNPVQVSAAGMGTAELKREFGRDIVLWGGGVDTQRTMPQGSPEQVRDETRRRVEDLMPGGGFVFAAVHNLQADVPPGNVLAMVEALRESGRYAADG